MKKTYFVFLIFSLLLFPNAKAQTTLNLDYAQSWGVPSGVYYADDYGKAIAVDASGNSYVAGNAGAPIDLDPGTSTFWTSGACFFIAKYNSSGGFLWAKVFSEPYFSNVITPNAIVLDASNNIYITGSFKGTNDFNPDPAITNNLIADSAFIYSWLPTQNAFFAKYDTDGNYVFAKNIGGKGDDNSKAIALDASSNIYLTGQFGDTADFNPDPLATQTLVATGTHDAFFAKYDVNGNYEWAHSIGDSGDDCGFSLALDASNNVYITGNFYGINVDFGAGNIFSSYFYDYFDPDLGQLTGYWYSTYLAKYTSAGTFIWADMIGGDKSGDPAQEIAVGGPYSYAFRPHSVKVDKQSNVFLMGAYQNSFDIDPAPLKTYTLNVTGEPTQVNIYFAKFNTQGQFVFAKEILSDYVFAFPYVLPGQMTLDIDGNILITGGLIGRADFDPDPSGTYILSSGNYSYPPGDFFMAKYSPTGDYIWAFNWGNKASSSFRISNTGNGIASDPSGNVYVTGIILNSSVSADVDPGTGTQLLKSKVANSLFVAKYDPNSTYLWAFTSDESDGGNDTPGQIAMDSHGNTYMVGTFTGTIDFDYGPGLHSLQASPYNTTDIVIAKYDTHGNYLWAKKIGGSGADKGLALALDASNNVYILGNFTGPADFDPDPLNTYNLAGGHASNGSPYATNMFLAKYDNNGILIWAKDFPTQVSLNINPTSLTIDASNNVFLGGYFSSTSGTFPKDIEMDPNGISSTSTLTLSTSGFKGFFAKYDTDGNFSWAKLLNGSSRLKGIAVDASGNASVTGFFSNKVDFDPGSVLTYTLTTGNLSITNIFIAQYSSTGACAWAKKIVASNSNAIATDVSGNIYITGDFTGTPDFDPAGGGHNLTATGSSDIFFAKYDASGNYVMAKSLQGTSGGWGSSIAVDATDEILLTGNFSGTIDFDPAGSSKTLTDNGLGDFFVAKYDVNGAYVAAKSFGGSQTDLSTSISSNATGDTICVFGSIKLPTAGIDFDPDPSVADTLTPLSGTDMFLAKYSIGLPRPIELVAVADNNIDCNLQCTGKATVTATRGTWPYTYSWNPGGATTNALTDLCEGTYTLTVTDAASIATAATVTVSIDQPSPVKGHIAGPANVCSDKLTTLNAVGGTCNVFLWGTGETTASISRTLSAPPGGRNWTSYTSTYSLTVSHNGLCPGDTTFTITVTPTPTATITGAGSICSGSSLLLDASGSATGGGNYMWSTGENTTAISASPLSTTTYSLVISTAASCGDTAWASIAVTTTPTAHIIYNKKILCSGDSATLTRTGTADNYTWSNGETKTSLSVKATETFTLTLSNGNCSDTDTLTVSVFTMPTAVITGETTTCSGRRNLLSATQVMPGLSYQWSTGASTQRINEYPLTNTTYSVVLANGGICRDSASLHITVTASPTLTLTANKTIICAGETAILQGSGTGTYQWSTGDAANTINASPASSQHFSLSLSNGSANGGCSAQDSVLITVIPMPTASISGPVTICSGNSTSITASSGSGATSYLWSTGESLATITILPLINTVYSVTASNGSANGGGLCTDTTSTSITLISAVPANAGFDITLAMGVDTVLSANDGAAWSWTPKYQIDCNTCQRATVRPFISTIYTLTVTDNNGCMSSDTVAIYIIPCQELFIPQAFSPNNDGKNDVLYIRGTDCIDKIVSFTIYNRWGEKVFESTDIKTGWDGTVSRIAISNDVFIYYLETLMINGETKSKMGNVTLMK